MFADPNLTLPVDGEGDHKSEPHRPDDEPESGALTAEAAALRDAHAIADRIAADEAAADAERQRLTREPLPSLPPDARVALHLRPGELLHAERRAALLERARESVPIGGTLYLTSQRLVHARQEAIQDCELSDVRDIAVAMERLLLVELADGSDLAIEVGQPRLLRVQVAAARAAARTGEGR